VFAAQLEKYEDLPHDVAQLEAVVHPKDPSWVDDDGKFVWQQGEAVISFGKHRGKSLVTLLRSHRDYLEWVLSGSFPESAKKVIREALEGTFPTQA